MTQKLSHGEIVEMLIRVTGEQGMDLARFHHLGRSDDLINPVLRDLWLIWGDVLTEDDLASAPA